MGLARGLCIHEKRHVLNQNIYFQLLELWQSLLDNILNRKRISVLFIINEMF